MNENQALPAKAGSPGATDDVTEYLHLLFEEREKDGKSEKGTNPDDHIGEVFVQGVKAGEHLRELLALAEEIPQDAVVSSVDQFWDIFEAATKQEFIEGLLKNTSDKAVTRQVAVARALATIDKESACAILSGLITGNHQSGDFWPKLNQHKTRAIAHHFFRQSDDWIPLDSADPEKLRPVLAAFMIVAATIDHKPSQQIRGSRAPKGQSVRFWSDFMKWAVGSLRNLDVSQAVREEAIQGVRSLQKASRHLPDAYKDEIEHLIATLPVAEREVSLKSPIAQKPTVPHHQSEEPLVTEFVRVVDDEPTAVRSGELRIEPAKIERFKPVSTREQEEPVGRPPREHLAKSQAETPRQPKGQRDRLSDADALIQRRLQEISQINDEIELIAWFKSALGAKLQSEEELESEVSRLNGQVDDLKSTISRMSEEVSESQRSRAIAQDKIKRMEEEVNELSGALNRERVERTAETQELVNRIAREADIRVEELKGKLQAKLARIFKNKRTTDDQEPDAKLAVFLRSWLTEIERELQSQGITLS